jgi:leucyl/phenylalanyl-tRNA--protein transferase
MSVPWLATDEAFPVPNNAFNPDPEVPGLIAISEEISSEQLLRAYGQGIFPWYSDGQPILWWSPNPRMVLKPKNLKISKSFKKDIKNILVDRDWEIKVDENFHETILSCATQSRYGQDGTWITHAIMHAYGTLHEQGYAHSVELFHQGQRVGGLYCVNIGQMVFGESMFSKSVNASKIALASLCAWCIEQDIEMIDCQQETDHLTSLGGKAIPREEFLAHIKKQCSAKNQEWRFNKNVLSYWLNQHS